MIFFKALQNFSELIFVR